jgi:hypothetical protein
MAINNKQILGKFQELTNNLKSIIKDKDKMMDEAKAGLSPEQLSEVNAMERLAKQKMDEGDFMGALRVIEKTKLSTKQTQK